MTVFTETQLQRWKRYPLEPDAHHEHDRSTTHAYYEEFVVCYCYTCESHYRQYAEQLAESEIPPGFYEGEQ